MLERVSIRQFPTWLSIVVVNQPSEREALRTEVKNEQDKNENQVVMRLRPTVRVDYAKEFCSSSLPNLSLDFLELNFQKIITFERDARLDQLLF